MSESSTSHQHSRRLTAEGKVVMVTGASAGIGREFCLDLAKSGYRIVACARRTDRLTSLCREINEMMTSSSEELRAVGVELDVSGDGVSIDASAEKAWSVFGRIDALVNNAGIRGNVLSPLDILEEEWSKVFKTNLSGLWLVSKCVCKRMHDAKIGGSVINISSIAGLNRGFLPGSVAYATSKAAVNTFTKMMAMELGMYKIRVNSIAPGLFKSEITENLMEQKWLNRVMKKTVPLGTYGTIDPALTSLVRYLVDDSSDYVTGNIFIVDAGVTLPGLPIFSSL